MIRAWIRQCPLRLVGAPKKQGLTPRSLISFGDGVMDRNAMVGRRWFSSYGSAVPPTMHIDEFNEVYTGLRPGERRMDVPVVLCGRLLSKPREASRKLFFGSMCGDLGSKVQILSSLSHWDDDSDFTELHRSLVKGDRVTVFGSPGKSKKGELSIVATRVINSAKCNRDIPSGRGDGKYALKEAKAGPRCQYFLANPDALQIIKARADVVKWIRNYLDENRYVEVETPMLGSRGGATAAPFYTQEGQFLRIAPELKLKEAIVSGFDRVYELGKVFRNEGKGSTRHQIEFTMLEYYTAWSSYTESMAFVEQMLAGVFRDVAGKTLATPFRRIDIIPALAEKYNMKREDFPDVNDAENTDQVAEALLGLIGDSHGWNAGSGAGNNTVASNCKLLDILVSRDLEPLCQEPTFLINHPIAISPLAKQSKVKGIAERFELVMNGMELANGYSELNDPEEQRQRLVSQTLGRADSSTEVDDDEVMLVDEQYIEVLQYGLPPTAGVGIGIDRLLMNLTSKAGKERPSIKDVILFPH
uniref:Aminoacyl-transfer RNA synthetases class-II family profile domain-containing protein n=1 Tax=Mucochytrium quahogii TaxID=96639 RepID=A0A7S2SL32_9STRA|mmetsp:Transcript_23140/g.36837  ORF Transcript_23140/g.36837 Transcript_23140/m.36837 type:complete len:529 (-) Transcript_23140:985-2571(-)